MAQVFWNQSRFFGNGNFTIPQAVKDNLSGDSSSSDDISALDQPFAFIMKSSFSNIAVNEVKTLKFAYGYVPTNQTVDHILLPFKGTNNSPYQETAKQWKKHSATFKVR